MLASTAATLAQQWRALTSHIGTTTATPPSPLQPTTRSNQHQTPPGQRQQPSLRPQRTRRPPTRNVPAVSPAVRPAPVPAIQPPVQQIPPGEPHNPKRTRRPASCLVASPFLRQPAVPLPPPDAPPRNITATFSTEHDAAGRSLPHNFFGHSPNASHLTGTGWLTSTQSGGGLAWLRQPCWHPPPLQQQAPEAFAQLLHQLQADDPRSPAVEADQHAATLIQNYGWQPPEWQHIADGLAPPRHHNSLEDGIALGRGWQHKAATTTHTAFRADGRQRLDPGSQALLESQRGPHASRAFTTIPYHNDSSYYPSHLFRLLLLRRFRLPLPLSARFCRCRRTLDSLGDHRAACAQSGLLRRARGGPLERAAGRICREAGARVTTNTRLVDLNLEHIDRQDDRKIKVIANGLPLWGAEPARSGHDPCLTTDARRGAKTTRGGFCWDNSSGRPSHKRAHIPRTAPQPTLLNMLPSKPLRHPFSKLHKASPTIRTPKVISPHSANFLPKRPPNRLFPTLGISFPKGVWILAPPKHIWRLASTNCINTVRSELDLDLTRKKNEKSARRKKVRIFWLSSLSAFVSDRSRIRGHRMFWTVEVSTVSEVLDLLFFFSPESIAKGSSGKSLEH